MNAPAYMFDKSMSLEETKRIVYSEFYAYYGYGYTWKNALEDYLRKHRDFTGISKNGYVGRLINGISSCRFYQAARMVKAEMSKKH